MLPDFYNEALAGSVSDLREIDPKKVDPKLVDALQKLICTVQTLLQTPEPGKTKPRGQEVYGGHVRAWFRSPATNRILWIHSNSAAEARRKPNGTQLEIRGFELDQALIPLRRLVTCILPATPEQVTTADLYQYQFTSAKAVLDMIACLNGAELIDKEKYDAYVKFRSHLPENALSTRF